jgi:hypothetical protein
MKRARPKSVTSGWPAASKTMFEGFQVAMQHAARVRMRDRARDAGDELRARAKIAAQPCDVLGEIAAFGELHAEPEVLALGADFVYRQNARMIETGHDFGLAPEAVARVLRPRPRRQQHLQRDRAPEIRLPCAVDDPCAAVRDRLDQPVTSDFARRLGAVVAGPERSAKEAARAKPVRKQRVARRTAGRAAQRVGSDRFAHSNDVSDSEPSTLRR